MFKSVYRSLSTDMERAKDVQLPNFSVQVIGETEMRDASQFDIIPSPPFPLKYYLPPNEEVGCVFSSSEEEEEEEKREMSIPSPPFSLESLKISDDSEKNSPMSIDRMLRSHCSLQPIKHRGFTKKEYSTPRWWLKPIVVKKEASTTNHRKRLSKKPEHKVPTWLVKPIIVKNSNK